MIERIKQHILQKYKISNPDKVNLMIRCLIKDIEESTGIAQKALEQNDQAALTRAAHSLKGVLSNAGFTDLAIEAKNLEHAAQQPRSRQELTEIFARLQASLERIA